MRLMSKYTNSLTPFEVLCMVDGCGHVWKARMSNVMKGHRCPKCYGYFKEMAERDRGTWVEVDISTTKHPYTWMKIDKCDWERIKPQIGSVYSVCNTGCISRYAQTKRRGRKMFIHRMVVDASCMEVDHINQDGLDNRKSNLRIVSRWQNATNIGIRSSNTSGVKGVYFHKKRNKWVARIHYEGKYKYLGTFGTIKEATKVRKEAEQKYHKGFIAEERTVI